MADRLARIWNGTAWEIISSQVAAPNAVATFQSLAPSSPVTGQIWIDSDDSLTYVWNGTAWVNSQALPSQSGQSGKYLTTSGLVASWADPFASPTFTGTVVLPTNTSIGNVSSTEIGYLDGVTSAIQTQIDGKEKSVPLQNTAPVSPSSSDLWVDNTVPASPVLKVYDGSSWISISGGSASDSDQNILASRIFA